MPIYWWNDCPRPQDLPEPIKRAPEYASGEHYYQKAIARNDGAMIRIGFYGGRVDTWERDGGGAWRLAKTEDPCKALVESIQAAAEQAMSARSEFRPRPDVN